VRKTVTDTREREGETACQAEKEAEGERQQAKDTAQSLPLNYLGRYQTGCFTWAE